MITYSLYDAKSKFSQLISLVEIGCHVCITKNGEPAAMLVPFPKQEQPSGARK